MRNRQNFIGTKRLREVSHNPVIGMLQETVDEVDHDIDEHFALWIAEDAGHEVEGDSAEAKGIDKGKRRRERQFLSFDLIENASNRVGKVARNHFKPEADRALDRSQSGFKLPG